MQAVDLVLHARPRGFRRAEYERLAQEGYFENERVELIHGIIVEMTPIGPAHSNPLDLLVELLVPPLVGRARVRVQQPFALGEDSEPEPDLAIVPPADYSGRHPDRAFLIVEVAESSLDYERETKGPLYAAAAVPEYWVVNVGARVVEVRDRPEEGLYRRKGDFAVDAELTVAAFPDVRLRVADLFP